MNRDYLAVDISRMDKETVWGLPLGGIRVSFSGEVVVMKTPLVPPLEI